jgi:hypothetical protein
MALEMGLYVIEYDTKQTSWKVNIAAHSSEEAVKYLKSRVSKILRIKSMSMNNRIDAITSEILNKLAKVQTLEVEKIVKVENTVEVVKMLCPYCDSEFASKKAVKGHITKMHK